MKSSDTYRIIIPVSDCVHVSNSASFIGSSSLLELASDVFEVTAE